MSCAGTILIMKMCLKSIHSLNTMSDQSLIVLSGGTSLTYTVELAMSCGE